MFAADVGWRVAFGLGAVLGLGIILVRRYVPESPRWLFIHGRDEEAEALVSGIERQVREETGQELEAPDRTLKVRQRRAIGFGTVTKTVFTLYPRRTVLGLALFIGQAFIYNAVFFTYALVLDKFYGVGADAVGWYIAAFAVGNFAGPLLLGPLFDSVGRKPMIAGTYIVSGALLAVTAVLFNAGTLTARHADDRLVRDLLLRLRGRERGLPDRVGDLPHGDARHGDLLLLRGRHGDRRHHRPAAVRAADRDGRRDQRHVRLPARRRR